MLQGVGDAMILVGLAVGLRVAVGVAAGVLVGEGLFVGSGVNVADGGGGEIGVSVGVGVTVEERLRIIELNMIPKTRPTHSRAITEAVITQGDKLKRFLLSLISSSKPFREGSQ